MNTDNVYEQILKVKSAKIGLYKALKDVEVELLNIELNLNRIELCLGDRYGTFDEGKNVVDENERVMECFGNHMAHMTYGFSGELFDECKVLRKMLKEIYRIGTHVPIEEAWQVQK